MAKFNWGKVIQEFEYDLDGPKIKVVKFHPWARGDNGSVLTRTPNVDEVAFHCDELNESFDNIQHLIIAWIARKNLGLNQFALVAGVARSLCVGQVLKNYRVKE